MDDREAVAAIVAGDPAGLEDAYDRYAASLYGYCRTMLHEPADAADAVQDTFVIAAARLGGLRDPRKLRPWLYAVARNECYRKLRSREAPAEIEETEDLTAEDVGQSAQRAELRELVRAAISGLNPPDREVIELNLRHDLEGAELASVLGVSRSHAHAMTSRARTQLERALGALLVARTGRRACPALDLMLADWDGRLSILLRKRVSRHIDQCEECGERKRRALRPAMLFGLPALPMLPPGLRERVMRLCAYETPATVDTKRQILKQAGSFLPNGFPRPIRDRRRRREPGAAWVAAVSVAAAAAVIIAMIALRGGTPPHTLDAKAGNGLTAAATTSDPAAPASSAQPAPNASPSSTVAAAIMNPPGSALLSPSSSVPASSHSAQPSKSPSPTKSPTRSPSKSPSPSRSPSRSPSPSQSPTPPPPPPTTLPPSTPPPTTPPPANN